MIILSYDLETTGLDKHKDRMIEVGLALYSTSQNKILESTGFLVQSDGVPVTKEITQITGVTQAAVDRFGYDPGDALDNIIEFAEQADAIATHNGNRFDIPVTHNTAKRLNRLFPEKLVIDTMTDIPGVDGEQLITMCAKRGFVSKDQHSAEEDAKSVLWLMRSHSTDGPEKSFEAIAERAKSPLVVILSHQGRDNNNAAKKFKFRWNPDLKIWWKAVKEVDVETLASQVSFDISRAGKEISLEQLWD